ncbi:hypothetical protein C427_4238 [Paraglaciecola psychrophila 170]|uniref:PPIase cyclophilin-type domain-containing protein n=1 Tax=Paraglaciecola psychrophila 170 TaxID=1129794 RepID=K7ASH5_9ALTE|nr:peptidylprolyl isomerase [Paraglaciecola psychrophila]AGH46343.1 hypothetical protein C427_4238 [Paraglaciecola psychrophila 170]GAC38210.1 hypothetical protein GPSY_2596 [Paraglaciecola psychrophila 170]
MKRLPALSFIQALTFCIGLSLITHDALANKNSLKPHPIRQAVIITSIGNIDIELYSEQAPVSVDNFINYIEAGLLMMADSIGWCD